MIRPWKLIHSKKIADHRIFRIFSDLKISPRTGRKHDFFVLHAPDWVNVIPITPDNQIVMVEQYRHGSNTVELEIPGGVMDPHETDPLATGLRELREETGYEGRNAQVIGKIHSNPAILNNTTHTLLVEDCELKHSVSLDQGEDLITRLVSMDDIPDLIAKGQIGHSLVVVAFYHYQLWKQGLSQNTD